MDRKWMGHLVSVTLVSLILISLVFYFNNSQTNSQKFQDSQIEQWLEKNYINFDDPLQKSILEESLNLYNPDAREEHAEQISKIDYYRNKQLLAAVKERDRTGGISREQIGELTVMYLKFIFVYIITLVLTFYGVQTFGTYRFVKEKQEQKRVPDKIKEILRERPRDQSLSAYWKAYSPLLIIIIKTFLKIISYLILFSPAYVLAYSFRTRFDTDTLFFMILLGVISNALLITYTQKFYTFLVGESRKGYIETAIVKNMNNDYTHGISFKSIFNWKKKFPGHVFDHIYENAHFQYLSTIKEQASFLITGLIIIEMALNIQNHLCYELLQNILYENYAIVALIVLGIYYIVKLTFVTIDWISELENRRYHNIV